MAHAELEALRQSIAIARMTLIVSVFLSIGTVVIGALNMAFQRSHNVKSVKPFCAFRRSFTGTHITIGILNAGLGPMIIKQVLLAGPHENGLSERPFAEVFPSGSNRLLTDGANEYILPSMGEVTLFHASLDEMTDEPLVLKRMLEVYTLRVVYQDVYDHKYERSQPIIF